MPWPKEIEQWRPLIEESARRNGVPFWWISAVMAIESGGRIVCLDANNPSKACEGSNCDCVTNEGIGLMATLKSTASAVMGRKVTAQELMSDPALSIEAGTRVLARNMRIYNNDYVASAVAFNAWSVKCGTGRVFVPAGKDWPKQACPDIGWAVVFGCTYQPKNRSGCVPSSNEGAPQPFVCTNNYPAQAIAAQNAARKHFGVRAQEQQSEVAAEKQKPSRGSRAVPLALGAIAGVIAVRFVSARF